MADDADDADEEIDPVEAEFKRLSDQLDDALSAFADYEGVLNEELKRAADPAQRAEIFARRAAYEECLGIEALLQQIDDVRAMRKR